MGGTKRNGTGDAWRVLSHEQSVMMTRAHIGLCRLFDLYCV
jgi:hypothetical protein